MTDENSLHDRRDDDCLFAAVALVYFTLLVLAAAVAVVVILEKGNAGRSRQGVGDLSFCWSTFVHLRRASVAPDSGKSVAFPSIAWLPSPFGRAISACPSSSFPSGFTRRLRRKALSPFA